MSDQWVEEPYLILIDYGQTTHLPCSFSENKVKFKLGFDFDVLKIFKLFNYGQLVWSKHQISYRSVIQLKKKLGR